MAAKTLPRKLTKPAVKPKTTAKKAPIKTTKKPVNKTAANNKTLEKTRKKQVAPILESADDTSLPDAGIDFCGVELTGKQRDFLKYYITPGQPCFHNALQSALKAGYKEKTAKTVIYVQLRGNDFQKIIKTNENLIHHRIHESAMRAIELKQHRAFFDPVDFFEKKKQKRYTKEGGEYEVEVMDLKDLADMSLEQRMCIDGIDIKGQGASIPVYVMADREKNLNDIIKIDSELSKGLGSNNEEETREIIMERITIRETRRASRPIEAEYEIVERPTLEGK